MNRTWVDNRLFRIAEDYVEAFVSWGFDVFMDCDFKGIPHLTVTGNSGR